MGVDLARFRTAPDARRTMRDRLGLSEGDVALLYAAEFSGRKSQHTLLEALPGLPENVKLLLPGSGALLDDCRAQAASLGVADRTVFPGQVHDMPRWLAAADIQQGAAAGQQELHVFRQAGQGLQQGMLALAAGEFRRVQQEIGRAHV